MATMTIADAFEQLIRGHCPCASRRTTAARAGPEDAPFGFELKNERGLAYLMTAPGDLGLGRAYVSGDLGVTGVHPGDPYEGLKALQKGLKLRCPSPAEPVKIVSGLGISHLKPPTPPKEETLPRWRRVVEGVRHSRTRDKEAIHHHYDVSNAFYEYVLGPSMTYTCAVLPHRGRDAGAGAVLQVRPGRAEARPEARHAAARRRLRLGRHGPSRRRALRREGARRDPVARAGDVGAGEDQEDGPRPPRRGAAQRLPRGHRVRLRRRLLDRPHRAHRRAELHVVLRVPARPPASAGPAAQPLHHPAAQQAPGDRRVHRPLRLPRRRADRVGPDHHRGAERRPRGDARGELPAPLRPHAGRLVPEPRGELGRLRRRGRRGHGPRLGAVHGRLAARLRAQRDPAPPRARGEDRRRWATTTTRCGRRSRWTPGTRRPEPAGRGTAETLGA